MILRRFQLVLAAAALLGACGRDLPWRRAAAVYVSGPTPCCAAQAATLTPCDPLAPAAADSLLLAALSDRELGDAGRLGGLTGLAWRQRTAAGRTLDLRFAASPDTRASYVLEVIRPTQRQDTVLSIASNGGTVVWLNGQLLGASRYAARPARADQDLYTVALRAGENRLLYRIVTSTAESQFHRRWLSVDSVPEALATAIALGAYSDLVVAPIFPDTARSVALAPPQVRLAGRPRVRFRWLGLLGDSIAPAGEYLAVYPASLPLPAEFRGMAVLETEVTDPASGRLLFLQQLPVFTDSVAYRLARRLAKPGTDADPVRTARVAAVRAAFALPPDTIPLGAWLQAHTLVNLYRYVRQPRDFFRYPGPQVWGYRALDGTVQPYWLLVPPSAVQPAGSAAGSPAPGLVFSVTHMVNPSFWLGRGRTTGWVSHMAALSVLHDNFGVLPHLRGRHDFAGLGVEEFATITRQVAAVFRIDTAAVAWLVWSAHGKQAAAIARHPDVSLAWLGIAVPALQRDVKQLASVLDSIRPVRPGLHWVLWRAADDDQIPSPLTEAWVRIIQRAGFAVDYQVVPYSTHLGGYYRDIESELNARVSPRTRTVPRQSRATR